VQENFALLPSRDRTSFGCISEILIRLQSSALDEIKRDIVEIKTILRKLLDRK